MPVASRPFLWIRPPGLLRHALVVACLVQVGCAPALLWYGHDPTRATRWELRAKNGQTWLEARPSSRRGSSAVGRSPHFDEIVVSEMAFAPRGGRLAFPARRAGKWYMVVDLQTSPPWEGLAPPRFDPSGAHLAYAALAGGRWRVVHDGRAGPEVDGVLDGTLTFSPNGQRLGYAAIEGTCVRVHIDHAPAPGCYQGVRALFVGEASSQDTFLVDGDGGLPTVVRGSDRQTLPELVGFSFAPQTGHWAAVVRAGERSRLLQEGALVAHGDEIADPTWSPSGRLAYARRDAGAWHLVVGGRAEGPFAWIRPVVFSPDGRRYGYVAGGQQAPDTREVVVVDGQVRGEFSAAEGLVWSRDGRRLAYAARRDAQMGIVCDQRFVPFDVVIETSITFSHDGRHWAALVGDSRARQLWIAVDGAPALRFDSEELFGAAAEDAADSTRLRDWVGAELERYLQAKGERRP